MTPERWRRIEDVLHRALARPPDTRSAFVNQECSEDETLRAEVESLIAHFGQATTFLGASLSQVAAELLEGNAALGAGRAISHYKVLSLIAAGGMGEVYLAQDTTLGRKAALKILPAFFTRDPARSLTFEQEARAASALNHPNILTIFEIGESDGIRFMATEFVDGQTLRQRMSGGPISIPEALDIACQVAAAVSAAHEAGIVHRDIKPANIMLRHDGYVKVLDFGLAKLIESRANGDQSAELTVKTELGIVVGTPHYMSPEQARGEELDPRTDIFSLGVVLFEMITGGLPFDGANTRDVIDAILTTDPLPLQNPEIPKELQQILTKALRKDKADRYQSSSALLFDLQQLKDRLQHPEAGGRTDPMTLETRPAGARNFKRIATVGLLTLLTGVVVLGILLRKLGDDVDRRPAEAKIELVNPEAYEAYLKGRQYWNKKSLQGYEKALASYQHALQVSPHYAAAYAGVAYCYNFLGMGMGSLSATEAAHRAKMAAKSALKLDANLPEAHAALAFTLHRYDWNWAEAETEYKRAIELDPPEAIFHVWYSELLRSLGRKDEAQLQVSLPRNTDPQSSVETGRAIAGSYLNTKRYEQTIAYYRRAVDSDTDPDTFRLRMDLAGYCLESGHYGEAAAEYQKVLVLFGPNVYPLARLGLTYARSAEVDKAERILETLEKEQRPGYLSYATAQIYAALGRKEAALTWLRKAYEEHAPQMVLCNREWAFDALRKDERFRNIVHSVGLPMDDRRP